MAKIPSRKSTVPKSTLPPNYTKLSQFIKKKKLSPFPQTYEKARQLLGKNYYLFFHHLACQMLILNEKFSLIFLQGNFSLLVEKFLSESFAW